MTTINRLSAVTTLAAGDNLVVYAPSQGDARRSSLTTLVSFLSSAFAGFTASSYVKVAPCLVSALPAAGSTGAGSGARAFVTDATATTFASTVAGGGANSVPVYSDGTNWKVG